MQSAEFWGLLLLWDQIRIGVAMARQLRTEKAQVWLKPQEKALCMLLADKHGVSFSDWVRQAMLEKAKKEAAS